ncbi:hypothetical protein [Circovirus-like genome DCCV-11]|uniref:hypothetical protein n=1 Tax=Circovirus-like genome DCCV-11 TaxID=1788439 RepID=UPI0007F9A05A|nr:hypothetical protein [Circovirus-like genome DCCV-11]AMB42985.1 hypothetical protein [Circovirus-like genome DCCV-11]
MPPLRLPFGSRPGLHWPQSSVDHYVQRRKQLLASGKAKFRRYALKKAYVGAWRKQARYGGFSGKYPPKRRLFPAQGRNRSRDQSHNQALRHLRALSLLFGRTKSKAVRRRQLQLGRRLGLSGKQVDSYSRNANL